MSGSAKNQPTKICEHCGRVIELRKKWLLNWEQIKYCSEKCRRAKGDPNFENDLMQLLKKRGAGKTICPSEILPENLKKEKAVMEQVRQAARRLVAKGEIEITQKGVVVDPSTAKGPIRLKLKKRGDLL
jgi:hypothetical protein